MYGKCVKDGCSERASSIAQGIALRIGYATLLRPERASSNGIKRITPLQGFMRE
jgi:hypothetical protein